MNIIQTVTLFDLSLGVNHGETMTVELPNGANFFDVSLGLNGVVSLFVPQATERTLETRHFMILRTDVEIDIQRIVAYLGTVEYAGQYLHIVEATPPRIDTERTALTPALLGGVDPVAPRTPEEAETRETIEN